MDNYPSVVVVEVEDGGSGSCLRRMTLESPRQTFPLSNFNLVLFRNTPLQRLGRTDLYSFL